MGAEKGGSKVDVWAKQRGLKLIFFPVPWKRVYTAKPTHHTHIMRTPIPTPTHPTHTPPHPHPHTPTTTHHHPTPTPSHDPPPHFGGEGGGVGGAPTPSPTPPKWGMATSSWKMLGDEQGRPLLDITFHVKKHMIQLVKTGKHSQHCDYFFPGAKAPGHQYPQCRLNTHCIGPVSYKKYHTKSEQH